MAKDDRVVVDCTRVAMEDATMRTLPARLVMLGSAAVIPLVGAGVSTALASQPAASGGYATTVSGVPPSVTVTETDQAKFVPADATVHVGQVVRWMNDGKMPHNVTFAGGPHSGTMTKGTTFELEFTKPGTYNYVCTIHQAQGMKGTITVTP
jgi:plastocyanin